MTDIDQKNIMEATTQRANVLDNLKESKNYHKMNYKVEQMRVSFWKNSGRWREQLVVGLVA
jgi:hypothetical protein